MRSYSHSKQSSWSIPFIAEMIACVAILAAGISALLSIGAQEMTARYYYDGSEEHETAIPFSVEKEADYLTVNLSFRLNTLHARTFVIGPDDCIDWIQVNGEQQDNVHGLCNMHPGYALLLSNLRAGNNEMQIRIHDTGGQGGMSFRTSWLDPLWITLLTLSLAVFSWMGWRLIGQIAKDTEARLLPAIMAIAFCLRLGLSWHGGFGGDIHLNQEWSRSAVEIGMIDSYQKQVNPEIMLPNYPPLNILMFASAGYFFKYTQSPDFDPELQAFDLIIKLPAIIADLLMIIAVYLLLVPMAGRKNAIAGAAIYAVHPAIIHDSAIWGQTDSVFTLFMTISLLLVQRHRWYWAGMAITTALLFKMQAIMLLPLLAVVAAFSWQRWIHALAGSVSILVPVFIPFVARGAFATIVNIYMNSVGYYSSLSSNAYNFWVMLYGRETGKSATDLFLNLIEHRTLGILLWLIVILSVTVGWYPAIQKDIKLHGKTGVTILSAGLIAYSFFLFNAEMHERYLFPYMAFGLPLLFLGRRATYLYLGASVLFTLNLVSIVAFTDFDRVLVQETFGGAHPVAIATGNVIVFFLTWSFCHAYQKTTVKPDKHDIFGFWKNLFTRRLSRKKVLR